MKARIGDIVMTLHGQGSVKKIEEIYAHYRYGVKHDAFPTALEQFKLDGSNCFKDDVIYYDEKEVTLVVFFIGKGG